MQRLTERCHLEQLRHSCTLGLLHRSTQYAIRPVKSKMSLFGTLGHNWLDLCHTELRRLFQQEFPARRLSDHGLDQHDVLLWLTILREELLDRAGHRTCIARSNTAFIADAFKVCRE